MPRGWRVDETGNVATILGPRGELLQLSSAASSVTDASERTQSVEELREAARRSLESVLAALLEGPIRKKTPSGFSNEEVLLRALNGNLVAGFVVHGPRTSVIATLDAAPDQGSVDVVRQSIQSISFENAY